MLVGSQTIKFESGGRATFKASTGDQLEFPVNGSVVGWLRACARRNGMTLEPAAP